MGTRVWAMVILIQVLAGDLINASEWRYFSPVLLSQTRNLGSGEANNLLAAFCHTSVHVVNGIGPTCSTRELGPKFSDIVDHVFHPKGIIFGHFLGPQTEDAAVAGWSMETHPFRWGGTLL